MRLTSNIIHNAPNVICWGTDTLTNTHIILLLDYIDKYVLPYPCLSCRRLGTIRLSDFREGLLSRWFSRGPSFEVIFARASFQATTVKPRSCWISRGPSFEVIFARASFQATTVKPRSCCFSRGPSFEVIFARASFQALAGNVGVVSGIFFLQNDRHNDMSATCRRHDTDHVGDIGPFWLLRCRVNVVSFRTNPDMSAPCRQKTPNSSTTIYYTDNTTTPTMVSVRPLSQRGFKG